ncbi:phytase [Calothrix sp. NIES-4071]|nr:phytase [Calothrix sp. NIES-4071]BAZ57969.1 phytase [Calothrix sp. NIES-4105]
MDSSTIRFSQFNASLNRNNEGDLVRDLSTPDNTQARAVAEIIQRNNPDILLINEFDYVTSDPLLPVKLLQENYLSISQNGATPVNYPYVYIAPSNTGIASGFDLNNNGSVVTTPGAPGYGDDAFGFGNFPGQFGMLLLSKYPIDTANIRTFQNFLWKDMPNSLLSTIATPGSSTPWYSPEEQEVLRLSSKSHWDIPIKINGETVHALVSHPTPPTFDGAEDRNGKRNHDEIRFWSDYIAPGQGNYIYDDAGQKGGLSSGAQFVIMGDQNADPNDGDSFDNAILQILNNPRVNTNFIPTSAGGVQQAQLQGGANLTQKGNPAFDTADFSDTAPGNLRVDYVLPSSNLTINNSAVYWPLNTDPQFALVGTFNSSLPGGFPSSDHRLVWSDVQVSPSQPGATIPNIDFLGQTIIPTGFIPEGTAGTVNGRPTPLGGLSGVTYDAANNRFYVISDDRSQFGPARFYTFTTNPNTITSTGATFTNVTPIKDASGNFYPELSLDPEGIALTNKDTVFISSEGEVNPSAGRVTNPFVNEYSLTTGQFIRSLPVPRKFLPVVQDTNANGNIDAGDTQTAGVRNNLAFESLTITPDQKFLYTATENALFQDGAVATTTNGTRSRIIQYNLVSGQPEKEYLYNTDAVAAPSNPTTAFNTNGLVDLLALDSRGTLLALERSFSTGAPGTGNTIKLYEITLQGASDISSFDSLNNLSGDKLAAIRPVEKRLLLNLDDLELSTGLDNVEGLAFGPKLDDGRQSIVLVSDNNFSSTQFTQILALDADLVPTVIPTVETRPDLIDDSSLPFSQRADADDPAIYVNSTDSQKSLVLGSVKNAGLRVYDLSGNLLQEINPGNIRYNNVDLQYGFKLGGQSIDIAVASDRNNDKLAIFQIDPNGTSGQYLKDITDSSIGTLFQAAPFAPPYSASTRSAYGLSLYNSPKTGDLYAFVNRRQTGDVGQFKLIDKGNGKIGAELVRNFTLPSPTAEGRSPQTEGSVVDQELGYFYIAQEDVGIWKFQAEPDGGNTATLIDKVRFEGGKNLTDDAEGLTIYYGKDGTGYLLASSQGDSTFAVYTREGSNDFLGRFAVGSNGAIDSVQQSDGADVVNVPLGPDFPFGLFVTHDGENLPAKIVDGENVSTNFKFVPWENIANAFPNPLTINTTTYNPRTPQANSLLNGIASGDTTQNSTVLWARSNFTGAVKFEYSTSSDFSNIAGTTTAHVTDTLQPVKVDVTGLNPGTQYYYRVTDAAGTTAAGKFNTGAENGTKAGLTFGVAGDWRGELSPYPAISNADERNLDFFIELGDTIYADFPSPALKNPDGTEKDQAITLDDYRTKHAEVYGKRYGQNTWGDLRASTSILATIDDHEVVNDFQGGEDLAKASASDQALYGANTGFVNDSPLYENGLQAFQEYNPIRDEFYGQTGDARTAGERKLYRYNTYGSDAATFVLDARSFRDAGLPAADPTNPTSFLVNSFNPNRTLLGRPQVQDLKQDLLDAQNKGITWKFVIVPEPAQNLGVLGASDRFEGYAAERTEILKYIDDNNIDNVVFISADIHGTLVNNLTYQTAPGQTQKATSVFEITTGSVAFDAPLGQTLAGIASDLGFLSPTQKAFYDSLPTAGKDNFIKNFVNQQITPFGYDPLGLDNNLPQADGLINANLLEGDYVAAHTFGWTEFDIDPTTQKLVLTTYGVDAYTREELEANPTDIINRTPRVVSQFEVNPRAAAIRGTDGDDTLYGTSADDNIYGFGGNDTIYAGEGNNLIRGGEGNNNLYAGAGNDYFDAGNGNNTFYAGEGNNRIFAGNGNNTVYTGAGNDFISLGNGNNTIYAGEGNNTITTANGNDLIYVGAGNDIINAGNGINTIYAGEGNNTITSSGIDTIYIGSGKDTFKLDKGAGEATIYGFGASDTISLGSGFKFNDITISQLGGDTQLRITSSNDLLATLKWVQSNTIISTTFA